MGAMFRCRFIASGRVQGVGFRAFVRRIASSLKLSGYAKNLPDGTVEIVAEGDSKRITQLAARVSSIKLALGVHVEKLAKKGSEEIKSPQYSSFGISY